MDIIDRPLCEMNLTIDNINYVKDLIKNGGWFQYEIDDLEAYAHIGTVNETSGIVDIYSHRELRLSRNGAQLISFSLNQSKPVSLKYGETITLSYSIVWSTSTETEFAGRNTVKQGANFFFASASPWSYVVFVMYFMLTIMVLVDVGILLLVKREERILLNNSDAAVRKSFHVSPRDAVRRPRKVWILSSVIGIGAHVLFFSLIATVVICLSSLRGGTGFSGTSLSLAYCLSQPVNGYVSGFVFRLYGGRAWWRTAALSILVMPMIGGTAYLLLHYVTDLSNSTRPLPIKKISLIVCIFCFACIPLHLVSSVYGRFRALSSTFNALSPTFSASANLGGSCNVSPACLPFAGPFSSGSNSSRSGRAGLKPSESNSKNRVSVSPHETTARPDSNLNSINKLVRNIRRRAEGFSALQSSGNFDITTTNSNGIHSDAGVSSYAQTPFLMPIALIAGAIPPACAFCISKGGLVAVWHKPLHLLFPVLITLIATMACCISFVAFASTYGLFKARDRRWHWLSVWSSIFCGCYVMLWVLASAFLRILEPLTAASPLEARLCEISYFVIIGIFIAIGAGMSHLSVSYWAASKFVWHVYKGTLGYDNIENKNEVKDE